MQGSRSTLSKFSLSTIAAVYQDDELGDIRAFAAFIRAQFRLNADRKFSQTLVRLAKYAKTLFAVKGPEWVVEQARKDGLPLERIADRLGLPIEREGRQGPWRII